MTTFFGPYSALDDIPSAGEPCLNVIADLFENWVGSQMPPSDASYFHSDLNIEFLCECIVVQDILKLVLVLFEEFILLLELLHK